jgi:hypothetical protein
VQALVISPFRTRVLPSFLNLVFALYPDALFNEHDTLTATGA